MMVNLAFQPAIVVIAFNRPASLERLLGSLAAADYSGYRDVTLVISMDGGASAEVLALADALNWAHGEKVLISHPANLGLRKHVIACGDLTAEYGSVILLEDDLLVSRNFFDYSVQCLNYYRDEPRVAGVSLYSYRLNENIYLPFAPLQDGHDVFFMQVPGSWGQAWTHMQWRAFKRFYDAQPVIAEGDKLPSNVKAWPESSWKKYFYKYLVDMNFFLVYPQNSYSTNFGDSGHHLNFDLNFLQVPLVNGCSSLSLKFVDLNESRVIYDAYFEMLPECFRQYGLDAPGEFLVDLYGTKQLNLFGEEYMFSIRNCKRKIAGFDIRLHPLVNNLIMGNMGEGISLGKKADFEELSLNKTRFLSVTESYVFAYTQQYVKESAAYKVGKYLLNPGLLLKRLLKLR